MADDQNKIKIDIGCGLDPRPGFIGLDIRKTSKADIIAKLPDLPFKNESVDFFRARHVMEHFESHQIFLILNEFARCLKKDGQVLIIVPHGTNPEAFQIDHKSYWSYNSPLTLVKGGLHDEWIGSHYELLSRKLLWMRKEYKGKLPFLVRFFNYVINKKPAVMERFAYLIGGIYEMEFILKKIN